MFKLLNLKAPRSKSVVNATCGKEDTPKTYIKPDDNENHKLNYEQNVSVFSAPEYHISN